MNYEIEALEIMLENEEGGMKVCEKAKEEVNKVQLPICLKQGT